MTQSGCSDKVEVDRIQDESTPAIEEAITDIAEPGPFDIISLEAPNGLRADWLPFGGRLNALYLPDGTQIVARLETAEQHDADTAYVGAMIGRVANRIAEGTFLIDGRRYRVPANENGHALHGGPDGFDRLVWQVTREEDELVFRHSSPDGHQTYPGNLDVTVRAKLTEQSLELSLIAITDHPTPVNLTHHGYWNPAGLLRTNVDSLQLMTPADQYVVTDDELIPTGEIARVDGTDFDFRTLRPIGPISLDHNFLVPGEGLREMAQLTDGVRTVTLLSDYPGFQIFTGETLAGAANMPARAALAIEPQYPPNAINNPIAGEDTILHPGEVYRHRIIYQFDGPGFAGQAEAQP